MEPSATNVPPHLAEQHLRALRNQEQFVGLTTEQATTLARELEMTVQPVLPDHAVTADYSPCRVRLWIGPDGTVRRTTVG